jgi:hypothetical protein
VDVNEPGVVYTTNNLAEAEILKNVLEGKASSASWTGKTRAASRVSSASESWCTSPAPPGPPVSETAKVYSLITNP